MSTRRRPLRCFTLERKAQREPGDKCPSCKRERLTTKPSYPEIAAICPACRWVRYVET